MGDLTRNFSRREFVCKCGCGDDKIDPELVDRLQFLRNALSRSISITSGVRCVAHNASVGGVENSTHVKRIAVDISTEGSSDRGAKLNAAISAGFRFIGIGRDFLHLDLRTSESLVVFDYYGVDHVA